MNNHILNNFNKRIIRFICGALLMCICSSISYATDVTEVDLTGLATGEDVNHQHVYNDVYDADNHWQECFICHDKKNVQAHTIARTDYALGYADCYTTNTYTVYCTDNCGYAYVTKDPHAQISDWIKHDNSIKHVKQCTRCGAWLEVEDCYKSNGQKITCTNLGTCAVCGYTYTADNVVHYGNGGRTGM